MRFDGIKKVSILVASSLLVSIANITNTYAENEGVLQQIAINTQNILQRVNDLPMILAAFIADLTAADESDQTAQMQGSFVSLGNVINEGLGKQNDTSTQMQLTAELFSPPPPASKITVADLTAPPNNQNSILKILPNVNDLSYLTIMGSPPSPKAPNVAQAPYNYILNSSGISLLHTMPNLNWQGALVDQLRYSNYYNTVMAIESYNGYILSQLSAEAQSGNALTKSQQDLIQKASSSDWLQQVSSEKMGIVFRQILMFQSQTYVLLSQLIQTQKQLLTAQAMTNTLLVTSMQVAEPTLVSRAQGVNPQS